MWLPEMMAGLEGSIDMEITVYRPAGRCLYPHIRYPDLVCTQQSIINVEYYETEKSFLMYL